LIPPKKSFHKTPYFHYVRQFRFTLAVAIDSNAAHTTQPVVMDEDYFMDNDNVFGVCDLVAFN
jgi:hypothetical protein